MGIRPDCHTFYMRMKNLNTETMEFPYSPSQKCNRCDDDQGVEEDRFQYAMFDCAGSSGELDCGNLCSTCFREVVQFANGQNPS